MTIVLCGGGSAGHITPLIAVAKELKEIDPSIRLVYVGEKFGKFSYLAEESRLFDGYRYIFAGKLRRYHNESLITRLLDFKTLFFNIRDVFKLLIGVLQSLWVFYSIKPDSVLLKGGYVCVPASIGAKLSGSMIVTHDSDALPGLSNRFAARFAKYHAVGMPAKYYSYPKESTVYVGVPINKGFVQFSTERVAKLKESYGLGPNSEVLLVTGGSNGARRLNKWASDSLVELMESNKNISVIMLVGKGNLDQGSKLVSKFTETRVKLLEFSTKLEELSGIADVIISRAGATTIAEFAAQKKAVILVPNPDLTGGHQLKNAKVFADSGSTEVVYESDLKTSVKPLIDKLTSLLGNKKTRQELGESLSKTLPNEPAARRLAELLLEPGSK